MPNDTRRNNVVSLGIAVFLMLERLREVPASSNAVSFGSGNVPMNFNFGEDCSYGFSVGHYDGRFELSKFQYA